MAFVGSAILGKETANGALPVGEIIRQTDAWPVLPTRDAEENRGSAGDPEIFVRVAPHLYHVSSDFAEESREASVFRPKDLPS